MDESTNKTRQDWVLRHPCPTLRHCGERGYSADVVIAGVKLRTVLTIDLFTKPLAWHATIARIQPDGRPVALDSLAGSDRLAMLGLAIEMLRGVGQNGTDALEIDAVSVGCGRTLTPQEVRTVASHARQFAPLALIAVGEINEYDFSDRTTQVGDGLHIPINREVIYGH
jgi:hypothetical protein